MKKRGKECRVWTSARNDWISTGLFQ